RPQQGEQGGGRDVFRMKLQGASPAAEVVGRDELPSRSNYFKGSDASRWLADVPNYSRVEARGVYPGIDLVLRSRPDQDRLFEHDWVVHRGADPSAIRVRWEGLQSVSVDQQGRLLLQTGGATVIQDAPVLYQESQGVRTSVQGRYLIHDDGSVGFEV